MGSLADETRWLDATEQAALVRNGEATPLELLEATIERAERIDPAINSLTWNLGRSIGPGIGGVIVAFWGVVPAMAVNCAAYLTPLVIAKPLKDIQRAVVAQHAFGWRAWPISRGTHWHLDVTRAGEGDILRG